MPPGHVRNGDAQDFAPNRFEIHGGSLQVLELGTWRVVHARARAFLHNDLAGPVTFSHGGRMLAVRRFMLREDDQIEGWGIVKYPCQRKYSRIRLVRK